MPASHRQSGVVILALVLALTGCGSGDDTSSGPGKSDKSSADPQPAPAGPAGPAGAADPVAWVSAFCGGLGEVITGASALGTAQTTPQGQKEALLAFADSSQRAMDGTAGKLAQVGPPKINDGKRIHDDVVTFFKTSAETVAGQRAKLAQLDPNDPEFVSKLSKVAGPDLGAAAAQVQQLGDNQELVPAFRASPQCKQLGAGGPR